VASFKRLAITSDLGTEHRGNVRKKFFAFMRNFIVRLKWVCDVFGLGVFVFFREARRSGSASRASCEERFVVDLLKRSKLALLVRPSVEVVITEHVVDVGNELSVAGVIELLFDIVRRVVFEARVGDLFGGCTIIVGAVI